MTRWAWDISSDDGGAKIYSYAKSLSFFGMATHHLFNRLLQFSRNMTRFLSFKFYLGVPISEVELRTQVISSFPSGSGHYATSTGSAFTKSMLQSGSCRWEDWLRLELACCFAGVGNNKGIQLSGQHDCQGKLPTRSNTGAV